MTKENKSSVITLQAAGGEPFDIDVLDIHSLVSLSPFVTDLLLNNGNVEAVNGTILEVVEIINNSTYPVFKSTKGLNPTLRALMNLDEFRKINYPCQL